MTEQTDKDTTTSDATESAPAAAQNAAAGVAASRQQTAATRKQVRAEQRAALFRSPAFIVGVVIVAFWVLSALLPGLLTSWGPKDFVSNAAGEGVVRAGPSGNAWFGTDQIGRDVYARVIFGARPVLIVAPLAAAIAVTAGTLLGLMIGYYRGWVDEIVSRIIEGFLSLPVILLAIIVLFTFGSSRPVLIGTIAVLFTPIVTRTIRSATLSEAQLDYVTSAKMRGENGLFIITREILPNVLNIIVVELTVRLGFAIFTVATLAFLGVVAEDLTDADWGVDVSANYNQIANGVWWPTIFPALAIASIVIAVNLIADSIDKATKS